MGNKKIKLFDENGNLKENSLAEAFRILMKYASILEKEPPLPDLNIDLDYIEKDWGDGE